MSNITGFVLVVVVLIIVLADNARTHVHEDTLRINQHNECVMKSAKPELCQ